MKTILSLLSTLLIFSGCSLSTFPKTVRISIDVETAKHVTRGARSGPLLPAMKCFGLVVGGISPAVTNAQVANRSASCLGFDGAFFGPYTYSQLTRGVSLPLPPTNLTFSVVGFDGVSDCGGGVSSLYNDTTTALNYSVGTPVTVNLATASTVSISAATYDNNAAVERSSLCPVQALTCTGADVCDTFNAANATSLSSHSLNTGGSWTDAFYQGSFIFANQLNLNAATTAQAATAVTPYSTNRMFASISASLGEGVGHSVGIILRYQDNGNYVKGEIYRTDGTALCVLNITEVVGNIPNYLATDPTLPYPTTCEYNKFYQLDFSYTGSAYELYYAGYRLQTSAVSTALSGTKLGVTSSRGGSYIQSPKFEIFRAVKNP